jgi:hypothetical protein
VSDVATKSSDDRAELLVNALLDCGFAVHRHPEVDRVEDMAAGVRGTGARLVAICARGSTDPARVHPFVLAIPEAEYILVAGDQPDPSTEREGDPAARGYYVDAVRNPDELAWVMRFICRGLGIANP